MFEVMYSFINTILGLNREVLTFTNMAVRAVIVYTMAIVLIRTGRKRFLARPSSFDLVLLLILGSVISRAITGNAPFFQTLGAALMLVLLHTLFAFLTFHSAQFGALIKGYPLVLIKDGQIQWDKMRLTQLTERDLLGALRRNAQVLDPSAVKLAIFERNGEISIIPRKKKPEIIEIKVEEGVKFIRIEITK